VGGKKGTNNRKRGGRGGKRRKKGRACLKKVPHRRIWRPTKEAKNFAGSPPEEEGKDESAKRGRKVWGEVREQMKGRKGESRPLWTTKRTRGKKEKECQTV